MDDGGQDEAEMLTISQLLAIDAVDGAETMNFVIKPMVFLSDRRLSRVSILRLK